MSYILVYISDDNTAPMAAVHEALWSVGSTVYPSETRNLDWVFNDLERKLHSLQNTVANIRSALADSAHQGDREDAPKSLEG